MVDASAAPVARGYMPNRADTEDWCTPPELVLVARRIVGPIDLDPCSNPFSIVHARREVWLPSWAEGRAVPAHVQLGDGLLEEWRGSVYVNPPYGPALDAWMDKAVGSALRSGADVLMLVPSKTSRKCWQRCVSHAAAVCFIDGRVSYLIAGGERSTATFSSALILWSTLRTRVHRFAYVCDRRVGHVMFPR